MEVQLYGKKGYEAAAVLINGKTSAAGYKNKNEKEQY